MNKDSQQPAIDANRQLALLVSTLIIAGCGLVYELIAGTLSSYLLGDSVTQFSLVIGVFMAALGLGSYLSRFVENHLIDRFIAIQLLLGLIGGLSTLILFTVFAQLGNFQLFVFGLLLIIGTLVGLEIPLIMRILKEHWQLGVNVSNVLTADYIGALLASVLFPLILVPQLGLIRTGLVFGCLNVAVAILTMVGFRSALSQPKRLKLYAVICAASLASAFMFANQFTSWMEHKIYHGEIIHSETSPYQRIVITKDGPATSLFLNGALQFNSLDEYRYHESLVHPAMSAARRKEHVLVLGGGDGMVVREVLKFAGVKHVTLVDLDPAITMLFRDNAMLAQLNAKALQNPKVSIVNNDAWLFLKEWQGAPFDVVISDLPDPRSLSISKLYSKAFYHLLARRISADGIIVTQATSPLHAREAFWAIEATIADTKHRNDAPRFQTTPYHTYIPSFGEWGFVIASQQGINWKALRAISNSRYLNQATLQSLVQFPHDMSKVDVEPNRLQDHKLVEYYENGWRRWHR